jgi:ubiquinone/menaquinone biosynthesis C-methylase UbiE
MTMMVDETIQLEKVNEAYDSPSWWYDVRGFFILTLCYHDTAWHEIGFFGDGMTANHLEVAVGSGTLLSVILTWRRLKKKPAIGITAFDYAERMLAGARRRFAKDSTVTLLRADAGQLDMPDSSFDSANIANAFHCFPEPDKCMRELFRVLKPGAEMRVNVVLEPPRAGVMAGIARRIDAWGIRKGILFKAYLPEDAVRICEGAGFTVARKYVKGYTLNLVLRKSAGQAEAAEA